MVPIHVTFHGKLLNHRCFISPKKCYYWCLRLIYTTFPNKQQQQTFWVFFLRWRSDWKPSRLGYCAPPISVDIAACDGWTCSAVSIHIQSALEEKTDGKKCDTWTKKRKYIVLIIVHQNSCAITQNTCWVYLRLHVLNYCLHLKMRPWATFSPDKILMRLLIKFEHELISVLSATGWQSVKTH